MTDVLGSISCCADLSKDIGETSVELVVCNCAVTKSCCLKWETCTYAAALAFSVADFVADACGYASFVKAVDDPGLIQPYIDAWLVLLIISGVLIVSEIALPIYSIRKLCAINVQQEEDDAEKFRLVAKYWSRINGISVIATEDGFIAMLRVLIAFKSEAAVNDLQTMTGAVSSIMAFVVTIMRHLLLMAQIITKLSKSEVLFSKCPAWSEGYCTRGTCGLYTLFFTTLLFSCCSVGMTAMSMAISLDAFDVYHDDDEDFLLNLTLLLLLIPAVLVVSVFLIIQARW